MHRFRSGGARDVTSTSQRLPPDVEIADDSLGVAFSLVGSPAARSGWSEVSPRTMTTLLSALIEPSPLHTKTGYRHSSSTLSIGWMKILIAIACRAFWQSRLKVRLWPISVRWDNFACRSVRRSGLMTLMCQLPPLVWSPHWFPENPATFVQLIDGMIVANSIVPPGVGALRYYRCWQAIFRHFATIRNS